jgi:hypothetical protein
VSTERAGPEPAYRRAPPAAPGPWVARSRHRSGHERCARRQAVHAPRVSCTGGQGRLRARRAKRGLRRDRPAPGRRARDGRDGAARRQVAACRRTPDRDGERRGGVGGDVPGAESRHLRLSGCDRRRDRRCRVPVARVGWPEAALETADPEPRGLSAVSPGSVSLEPAVGGQPEEGHRVLPAGDRCGSGVRARPFGPRGQLCPPTNAGAATGRDDHAPRSGGGRERPGHRRLAGGGSLGARVCQVAL